MVYQHERSRPIRTGYRLHDHCTAWQECDTCGYRNGAGIWTEYDADYYVQDDPSVCPRCHAGIMALPDDAPQN